MALSTFFSESDPDDDARDDDDAEDLAAELDRIDRRAWDERDARIAFAIRAAAEDLALATLSPWSTEAPY